MADPEHPLNSAPGVGEHLAALGRGLAPGCARWKEPCPARGMGAGPWEYPGHCCGPGAETRQDSPQDGMALGRAVAALGLPQPGNPAQQGTGGSVASAMQQWGWEAGSSSAGQEGGQESGSSVSKITGWY